MYARKFVFLIDPAIITIMTEYTKPTEDEPQMFSDVCKYPDPKTWRKGQEAIQKMEKWQVWRKVLKTLMPPNYRSIKNKWVFKIKCNSVNQIYLVACGSSQVYRVKFSKNYSPIVNDITFCILLLMIIHFRFLAKLVNVKTAFLYGKLEKRFIWNVPKEYQM